MVQTKKNNVAEVPMSVIGWVAPRLNNNLKQEAIKWIKAIRKEKEEIAKLPAMHTLDEKRFPLLKYHGAEDWIIHNYNLTDEDLK